MTKEPTRRFTDRVENYLKYRPGYPEGLITYLQQEQGLKADSIIADIGSGTGFLTELFLKNGNRVFGLEPNREMRIAGENYLSGYQNFISLDKTAEDTGLENGSIDFIVAGQAFHWFDLNKTKPEFARVLRPGGKTVLVWNSKRTGTDPFLIDYDKLLNTYGTDYSEVKCENINDSIISVFFEGRFTLKVFENYQIFDFEGLKGRLLSSSYAPTPESSLYEEMMAELLRIYKKHEKNGQIKFSYDTKVYVGLIGF